MVTLPPDIRSIILEINANEFWYGIYGSMIDEIENGQRVAEEFDREFGIRPPIQVHLVIPGGEIVKGCENVLRALRTKRVMGMELHIKNMRYGKIWVYHQEPRKIKKLK